MNQLDQYIQQIAHRTASPEMVAQLIELIRTDTSGEVTQRIETVLSEMSADTALPQRDDAYWQQISAAVLSTASTLPKRKIAPVRFIHKWHWAAAILLILTIGSGIYYLNHQSSQSQKSNKSQFRQQTQAYNIPPGTNKAILTLSNGTQKELSLADNGLRLQSDAVLLTTPNGGQYQAVLPDGSKVWLNAASSIKFPSTFTDKERKVEITGEVYFEIAKDPSKPFFVQTSKDNITVLGTSFNINSYPDELYAKTSLIEGSIKVNDKILKPGEAYQNGERTKTNVEQDIAWKNNIFDFNNKTLEQTLRMLSRWYDIDIEYPNGPPNERIKGRMGRDLNLADVLYILKASGLKTTLKGRTLVVFAQ